MASSRVVLGHFSSHLPSGKSYPTGSEKTDKRFLEVTLQRRQAEEGAYLLVPPF